MTLLLRQFESLSGLKQRVADLFKVWVPIVDNEGKQLEISDFLLCLRIHFCDRKFELMLESCGPNSSQINLIISFSLSAELFPKYGESTKRANFNLQWPESSASATYLTGKTENESSMQVVLSFRVILG